MHFYVIMTCNYNTRDCILSEYKNSVGFIEWNYNKCKSFIYLLFVHILPI